MTSAGHHTMLGAGGAPSSFRYVAVKMIAARILHNAASLSAYSSTNRTGRMQLSEVQFLNSGGSAFSYPSSMTLATFNAFNGRRFRTDPVPWANVNSGETVGRLFDGSTSTKLCAYYSLLGPSANSDVYDFDTNQVVMENGTSYNQAWHVQNLGAYEPLPIALVLDLGSTPLDISVYSRWQFLNANDNASQTNRTWIEGEILGSADFKTWWRLDVFNDASIVNTNYAVARLAPLVPRAGDLWSDLDLADRDWANGIAVDGI